VLVDDRRKALDAMHAMHAVDQEERSLLTDFVLNHRAPSAPDAHTEREQQSEQTHTTVLCR
jgi:hypothetical protein